MRGRSEERDRYDTTSIRWTAPQAAAPTGEAGPRPNFSAEVGLVSALLRAPQHFAATGCWIEPDDITRPELRQMYVEIGALFAETGRVDVAVFQARLDALGMLGTAPGRDAAAVVVAESTESSEPVLLAREVARAAHRRRVWESLTALRRTATLPLIHRDEVQAKFDETLAALRRSPLNDGTSLTALSTLTPRAISWLWEERLPAGQITLVEGASGAGKSLLAADLAARVSQGSPWPDGAANLAGSALLAARDDDPERVLRPRLEACGADLSRVQIWTGAEARRIPGEDLSLSLRDVRRLEELLAAAPDCRLIVVDPFASLGRRRDAKEVAAVLAALARLAESSGAAVLLCTPLRGGSRDGGLFPGARRHIAAEWRLQNDPADPGRKLLLPTRTYPGAERTGLAFTIESDSPCVVWEPDPIDEDTTSRFVAKACTKNSIPGPEPEVQLAAAGWLNEFLGGEERTVAEVRRSSASAGHNWRTVQRAAISLRVERVPLHYPKTWRLPANGLQG